MTEALRPIALPRRVLLRAGSIVLLLGTAQIARGASVVAVRIWPAEDYTRVTIESDLPLNARSFMVNEPPRLAVDIDGMDLVPELRELVAKLQADDPNIAGIRVGQNSPTVVRLVIDLKHAIKPQVFTLEPVAAYQHRLVFDLYPATPPDPLQQLVAQRGQARDEASERAARLLGLETERLAKTSPAHPPASPPASPAHDPLGDWIHKGGRPGEQATAKATPPASNKADNPPAATPDAPTAVAKGPPASKQRPGANKGKTERLIVVALDPGHGGEDPGASGPKGTREKNVVLQIAHKLRERINATTVNGNPMRAFMTRDADFFVPLQTRVAKAQKVRADLFISIHADAFYSPDPAGASVYALSTRGASSAAARWMANKENASDLVGGVNVKSKDATVQRALLDMSTTAQINDSLKIGSQLLGEVRRVGKLHKPRVEQANFAVLRAPDIPSVLVETAFISNPEEERRLNDPKYQNDLADALLRGIVKYFEANPPLARNRQI
ncbi:MAG: N-acetylmuramoyl-L-alanine amidase [Hydrogenophaga sp.]|uniref:N-acetylmuramoyl-L-alanine amidase n=1 Tax=Hydrogenophaga sp. TaxID=1904254 RepID=UPI001DD6F502|nr:N-acetylmuramoyl-L-alanine amidase [Hydrogenophaga sp.]MBX3611299.1 N-acetylmuramoyl-L-alanine amidase [Hydrogenophaga sp.]